ncbi:hypothetical protein QG516_25795 [Pedobacter gandavensis]|uniref:hypothetical protein n=1 Tax=Pedobacter gandavensis TaxID=2679963 RepID=UPI00247841B0|nr:hypothetical protein [Pedobacter gandavensis]WGQ09930.1 hypothetical protein QG516_25795 [Pedobacter gandavensis]
MDKQLFNEAFKRNGKIYEPDEDSEIYLTNIFLVDFNKILKDLKTSLPSMPQIEVNFLDGNNLGANAVIYKDRYFIAIQQGSLKILMDIFLRMLASPTIFPILGISAKEQENEKVEVAQIRSYERFLLNDIKMQMPNDIRRKEVALLMLRYAIRQLFLHELAHLIRGHYHWLYIEGNSKDCPPLIRQGMEMDADRFAINLVLNQFKLEDEQADLPNTHLVLEEQIFIWGFALAISLNLFPDMEDASDFDNTETPPVALRYGLILTETVFTVFKDHKKLKDISAAIFQAIKLPKEAFSQIQTERPYTHFNMSICPKMMEHNKKIHKAWMEFENELSTISLVSLGYN